MKALHNYITTDECGYRYVATLVKSGVSDVDDIVDDLLAAGATVGEIPMPGVFLIGNMYNPELDWINGGVGVTSRIAAVIEMFDGCYMVMTESRSEYALYDPRYRFEAVGSDFFI